MSRKRYLCIKNFDEAKHYRDRTPIWIKLQCAILDDYDFSNLPDEAKFHALGLTVLAARLNNKFPEDEQWLRQKINARSEIDLETLLGIGFLAIVESESTAKPAAKKERENERIVRKPNKTQGRSASALGDENKKRASTEQKRTEENRTEHNTTQQNRTNETREPSLGAAEAKTAAAAVAVSCVFENSPEKAAADRVTAEPAADRPPAVEVAADRPRSAEAAEPPQTVVAPGAQNPAHKTPSPPLRAEKNEPLSEFSLADCLRYVRICEQRGEAIRNPQGLATNICQTGKADAFIRAALYPEREAAAEKELYGEPRRFSAEPCAACFGSKMEIVKGRGARICGRCRNERGKATGFEPADEAAAREKEEEKENAEE